MTHPEPVTATTDSFLLAESPVLGPVASRSANPISHPLSGRLFTLRTPHRGAPPLLWSGSAGPDFAPVPEGGHE